MDEQLNEQQAPPPSKEDVINFLAEQMEVKEAQYKLQEINTKLAVARAEELKALQFIAQMTNPQPPADAVPHNLTQQDMDDNPELSEQGFKVGDEVLVPKEQAAQRKLKK
jgi:uncharacterized protein YneF (UPF0154 family)